MIDINAIGIRRANAVDDGAIIMYRGLAISGSVAWDGMSSHRRALNIMRQMLRCVLDHNRGTLTTIHQGEWSVIHEILERSKPYVREGRA